MIPDHSDHEHEVHDIDAPVIGRARARAKAAWAASMREDDRLHRAASEKRLAASWPRPRVLPVRSFVMGAAAACCATVVAFAIARSDGSSSNATSATSATATTARTGSAGTVAVGAVDVGPLVVPVGALPGAPHVDARPAPGAMVVIGACPECRVGGAAMDPGGTVAAGRALSVPRGSRITLGFAMSGPAGTPSGPLVDPAVGIDVEGPAIATTDDQALALDRGSARFRGLRDVVVTVPGGVIESANATFTVRVDAHGAAHIVVESGRVAVTSHATREKRNVDAGAALDVAGAPPAENLATASTTAAPPAGLATAATSRSTPATAPSIGTGSAAHADESLDAVSRARARFHDGDAPGARIELEALARSRDPGVARGASFTLAEIEMASGERERGRARLAELTTSPDARLASDAATLLARSEPSASARADAWGRYLATSPPAAYRDRALLERADALVDAGRANEANAALDQLRGASLSEAQQRQLARISSKVKERR